MPGWLRLGVPKDQCCLRWAITPLPQCLTFHPCSHSISLSISSFLFPISLSLSHALCLSTPCVKFASFFPTPWTTVPQWGRETETGREQQWKSWKVKKREGTIGFYIYINVYCCMNIHCDMVYVWLPLFTITVCPFWYKHKQQLKIATSLKLEVWHVLWPQHTLDFFTTYDLLAAFMYVVSNQHSNIFNQCYVQYVGRICTICLITSDKNLDISSCTKCKKKKKVGSLIMEDKVRSIVTEVNQYKCKI